MQSHKVASPLALILAQVALWLGATIGYFGAWVTRQPRSAALSWNAYELFDLLRLLPEIETGAVSVNLHTFRLPILGLAMILPLLVSSLNQRGKEKLALKVGVTTISGVLCMLTLPPYPEILSAWHTPGWRVAFWWAVVAGLAVLALTWHPIYKQQIRRWAIISIALLTGIPAIITRQRLTPALVTLHNTPVQWGPGIWLWAICTGLLALGLWVTLFTSLRQRSMD